ncbi:MAG: pseudouridine synthase, partial [Paracoccaceae bacterium]
MTDDTPDPKDPKAPKPPAAERIAKAMARAGVASRRDAERLILAGRVTVNGAVVTSPALDVLPADKVTLDGTPIDAPQRTRLWLYYKPLGLVTSEKDEKGRQTVFESLPDGMPRVMSVGRLDLNSEGLLLLTNDGALKRRLELPETGWLRKYRVRVNGRPTDEMMKPLRDGVTVTGADGKAEAFLPMDITIDRQQGANAWLTLGLREGKNREIRRAMTEIGLVVNRLIRVGYGPFRLSDMNPGDVTEVKAKTMREQLGGLLGDAAGGEPSGTAKPARRKPAGADRRGPPGEGGRQE